MHGTCTDRRVIRNGVTIDVTRTVVLVAVGGGVPLWGAGGVLLARKVVAAVAIRSAARLLQVCAAVLLLVQH